MNSRGTAPSRRVLLGAALATVLLLGACAVSDDHPSRAGGDGPPVPGVTTAPTAPGPTPPASTDPMAPCPASGIRVRALGVDAAMGLRALGLELVNCGDRPYRVNGFPSLRMLDEDREPITVQVLNGAKEITSGFDRPPREVVLAPGERAGAAVLWRNLVTNPTVPATNGAYLLVAPVAGQPDQEVAVEGGIDLGNTGRVGVSAWKKLATSAPAPTEPPGPPAPTGVPTTVDPPDSRL